ERRHDLRPRRSRPRHGRGGLRSAPVGRLPGGDDDNREDGDRRERDEHDARLHAPVAALRTGRRPADTRLVVVGPADEARVELVDVQLAVQAEVLGVRAQETLDVGLRREELELLVLERAEVLAADLRRELRLREVEAPALASLPEAVADLEHAPERVAGPWRARLLRPAQRPVDGERDPGDHADVDARPREHAGRPDAAARVRVDAARRGEARAARDADGDEPEQDRGGDGGPQRLEERQVRDELRRGDAGRNGEDGERAEDRGGAREATASHTAGWRPPGRSTGRS